MSEQKDKLGVFPFVIGGLSFVPLIGVLFGLVSIIWGLGSRKAGGGKLALIGGGGILFTIVFYSTLFYFGAVHRGGIYDELRVDLSKTMITSLVQAIEFYKLQNGTYPESLEVLQQSFPEDPTVIVFDPAEIRVGGQPRFYHYELIDSDHYYLLGVGADGLPFTADDVLPKIEVNPQGRVGLVIKGIESQQ